MADCKTRAVTMTPTGFQLLGEFSRGRVWLNPPYGRATEGDLALIVARTDTRTQHDCVFPCARAMMFVKRWVTWPEGSFAAFHRVDDDG